MERISITAIIRQTVRFVFQNSRAILSRAILPFFASWAVLYFSASVYLSKLGSLLHSGGDDVASLVLGAATAGLLVFLFVHAVLRMAITALVVGDEARTPWLYFHIGRREWRLYGASLRILLIIVPFLIVVQVIAGLLAAQTGGRFSQTVSLLTDVAMIGGAVILGSRFLLVAPAVTLLEKGQILRRSWRLTGANTWYVVLTSTLLIVPGVLFEMGGEYLLRLGGLNPRLPSALSMADAITVLRETLPALFFVLMFTYLIVTVLITVSGAFIYRSLIAEADRVE